MKDAIKLVNKYFALDAEDQQAFDALRRDRKPKKSRKRRPKTQATDVTNSAPEPKPEKPAPKKRGRKPKQMSIADAEVDPLDAALKGVV